MSIYQVTQMLQDTNIIKNDLDQAFNLIKDMFYKKYLEKIQLEIKAKRDQLKVNRPKEVELLYALKPFMPKEKYHIIDNAAEYIIILKTMQGLQSELNSESRLDMANKNNKFSHNLTQAQSKDDSEHQDGVYDLDTNCLEQKNASFINAILVLAICSAL